MTLTHKCMTLEPAQMERFKNMAEGFGAKYTFDVMAEYTDVCDSKSPSN